MNRALVLLLSATLLGACDPGVTPSDAGGDAPYADVLRVPDAPRDGGSADAPGTDAPVATADIHYVGRFDFSEGEDTPSFAWPGSEIVARFTGTTISASLEATGEVWFEAMIDGERGEGIELSAGTHDYVLAEGLSDGEHEVRLVRRNETFVSGATTFLGFSGATLVPSPAPYDRHIEIIGDSITCGYGALGPGPGCPFIPSEESEPDAYGAVAARALGAGHTAIAWSGIGLTQNYGGSTTDLMDVRFERTLGDRAGDWGFERQPDAVVITLGTNDFWDGDPGTDFADAMDAFVQQVREHYPDAPIFLATSPMLGGSSHTTHAGYLDTAIERAAARGDTEVRRVDLPTQSSADGLGCDYHPSAATHQIDGDILADAIRDVTGW